MGCLTSRTIIKVRGENTKIKEPKDIALCYKKRVSKTITPALDLSKLSSLDRFCAYFADVMDFFPQGFGDAALLQSLMKTSATFSAATDLEITWTEEWETPNAKHQKGSFATPFRHEAFPKECHKASVELVLPKSASDPPPICLHFAATGDTGLVRRRNLMAVPLAQMGIASLILENPFYGSRKPSRQRGFSPTHVLDLWSMANATVSEGVTLLSWLKRQGYDAKGVTGISMGGYMAGLVGSCYEGEVCVIPCLAPHSGASVFTEGVLAKACNWKALAADAPPQTDPKTFLHEILSGTDARLFSPPQRTDACILVAGRYDAYVPPYSAKILHEHWSGSEIRWLDTGHVGAFFFHRKHFLSAIADAFSRL